jgi:hypothetical protein
MNLFRLLWDADFLMSGVAMVRDVPRILRLRPVDGSLFFTEEKRQEFRQRIESVTARSPRRWGTMEVDQMLHHLNLACGGSLGFYDLPDESNVLTRTLGKWVTVDWFPEQPVGLRLPKNFKIAPSQRFEYAQEKAQLLRIVEAAWRARTDKDWKPHPLFGKMTPNEWGKLLQMHLDYHLRQFAA